MLERSFNAVYPTYPYSAPVSVVAVSPGHPYFLFVNVLVEKPSIPA
jgi:hypothetical protein